MNSTWYHKLLIIKQYFNFLRCFFAFLSYLLAKDSYSFYNFSAYLLDLNCWRQTDSSLKMQRNCQVLPELLALSPKFLLQTLQQIHRLQIYGWSCWLEPKLTSVSLASSLRTPLQVFHCKIIKSSWQAKYKDLLAWIYSPSEAMKKAYAAFRIQQSLSWNLSST